VLGTILLGWISSYSWGLIAPPTKVESEHLKTAQETQADLQAIKRLLENKNTADAGRTLNGQKEAEHALDTFIGENNLDQKYPLGFAIFYSDGHKNLSYGKPFNSRISFDPSTLVVMAKDDKLACLNVLPVKLTENY
jgi:hypothetical protein